MFAGPVNAWMRCLIANLGKSVLWSFVLFTSLAANAADDTACGTLGSAFVAAYQGNSQLNAERARQRATDESVPQALSGYRPQISAGASVGLQIVKNGLPDGSVQTGTLHPWTAGVSISQSLFNGFRTANSVRQAEAQIRSGREMVRNVEQNIFFAVATAQMNVVADQRVVQIQHENLRFIEDLQKGLQRREDAGRQLPTGMAALAKARLSRGKADLIAARVALAADLATYTQVVGVKPGCDLLPAEPIDKLLPHSKNEALAISQRAHPLVIAAQHDVDAAQLAVKVAESALAPSVSVQGNLSRSGETDTSFGTTRTDQASVIGQANVPIYDGGLTSSQVRQAKGTLAQTRLILDQTRRQNEAAFTTAWTANDLSKASLQAATEEANAA